MPQPIITDGFLKLMPYSLINLCSIYGVCDRTFKKWIAPFSEEIGSRRGRFFTITQVRTILKHLGLPSDISLNE
jgi:hypothetical protein